MNFVAVNKNQVILSVSEKFSRTGSVLIGYCDIKICNLRTAPPELVSLEKNQITSLKMNLSQTSYRQMFKDIVGFRNKVQIGL